MFSHSKIANSRFRRSKHGNSSSFFLSNIYPGASNLEELV